MKRYELEPESREGKKELLERARQHEEQRDRALKQDPYFDYAEALLQIAIVLISVAIVANLLWLSYLGGALGLVGMLLSLNGFLLLVEIRRPFLRITPMTTGSRAADAARRRSTLRSSAGSQTR